MSKKKITLLLIDCQQSFHSGGSLAVPNADEDVKRICALFDSNDDNNVTISRIVATMDTHAVLDMAHPYFWKKKQEEGAGEGTIHPDPFTLISSKEVEDGIWIPREEVKVDGESLVDESYFKGGRPDGVFNLRQYCIDYTRALEATQKFQLCIWPEHCILGTPGHALVPDLRTVLTQWERDTGSSVEFVHKGMNPLTEMYSAFQAEVPLTKETALNHGLVDSLLEEEDGVLWVAGQASSHCVNFTTRDLVEHWPKDRRHQIYVLEDCTSPVTGFESASESFFQDMKTAGVHICPVAQAVEQVQSS